MMEAASTSETSVNYQTARRYNPEYSHLHCIVVTITGFVDFVCRLVF
jgi:hypothetical protein